MSLLIQCQIVDLEVNSHRLSSVKAVLKIRINLGPSYHEWASSHLFQRKLLNIVGQNNAAGGQFILFISWNAESFVDSSHVTTIEILEHQLQFIETRTQGNCLLVPRRFFQRLLEQRLRCVHAHDIFKYLCHAPSDS